MYAIMLVKSCCIVLFHSLHGAVVKCEHQNPISMKFLHSLRIGATSLILNNALKLFVVRVLVACNLASQLTAFLRTRTEILSTIVDVTVGTD